MTRKYFFELKSVLFLFAATVALFISVSAEAATIKVFALAHSTNASLGGAGTGVDTGVDVLSGDTLSVSVALTDYWSAGTWPRESNADGLGPNPPLIYSSWNYGIYNGLTYFGTLVGRIGSGNYFTVGTSYQEISAESGRLFLGYWDSNNSDNTGYVTATVNVQPGAQGNVPEPSLMTLLGLGFVGLVIRQKTKVQKKS